MSLKPPKRSDRDKAWMQPRRDRAKRLQPEYHLIVTEGTHTEPAYFQAIQRVINAHYRGRIQLEIYGGGDNTLNLLDKARNRAEDNPNGYKHIWVVFDTDDFPAGHIDQTARLCREWSDEESTYHAIWSNQCFELWYLLHFRLMQSDLHRSKYWPKLSAHLRALGVGEYTKSRQDMYSILHSRMEHAIENAKRLEEQNEGKSPSQSAPGTRMHELIETLRPYLTENAHEASIVNRP